MSLKKLGRYDLIRVLGKGAMGLVYEGRDPNLDRRVAIKTIRVEDLSEQAAADYEHRFRVEARSAARLQHPNIVSVYDSDRDGDIAFLVMEFIQGEDLKHHLDQGKRHSLSETVKIMDDLLSALDYAHRQSIVHRDIKPANLLIEADGRVKLTDFGVARIQDSGDATRTQGTMVGTLKYMSPEQVQGRPVDARADLFAAGIVLYQLLTGKRPFDGESDFAVIQQVVGHIPAAPSSVNPDLPPAIDVVVAMALAKSRDQRFTTAQAFAAALQAASREAADPTIVPPASPPRKRNNATGTGTGAVSAGEVSMGLQSDIGLSLSTVTQEVELVYWKDIKESDDVEDLQGFLAKFPTGIYADLARRRLRKLGVLAGEDCNGAAQSGTGTWVISKAASQAEKTVFIPASDTVRLDAVPLGNVRDLPQRYDETIVLEPVSAAQAAADKGLAVEAGRAAVVAAIAQPAPVSETPVTAGHDGDPAIQRNRSEPSFTPSNGPAPRALAEGLPPASGARRWVWAMLGLLVLAGFGLGARMLRPAAGLPMAQSAGLADKEEIVVASPPVRTPVAAPVIAAESAVPATVASAPVNGAAKLAVVAAPEPAKAVSERKAVNDKRTPAKPVAAMALANADAVATAPAESAAAPRVSTTSPQQACEDRLLIAFQMCMAAQCAKPAFVGHPLCVERRAMDQRRREAQQFR